MAPCTFRPESGQPVWFLLACRLPARLLPLLLRKALLLSELVDTEPRDVASPPLEPTPREFLLAEAKDRYKAEYERYTQVFTRAGIYLGVLALYISVAARSEKLFQNPSYSVLWWTVSGLLGLFLCATALTVTSVVVAILTREFGFIPEPGSWIEFIDDKLRPYLQEGGDGTSTDAPIAEELKQQVLEQYVKAIDYNIQINQKCRQWLAFASYGLLVGIVSLIIGACLYGYLSFGSPPSTDIVHVQLIDPSKVPEHNKATASHDDKNPTSHPNTK